MDPTACLDLFEQAINDGDFEEAISHSHNYMQWRARGGFEPKDGDKRWKALSDRLPDLAARIKADQTGLDSALPQ